MSIQGAWPLSREFACYAVQSRSLECQAACEAREGREGSAHSGVEEVDGPVSWELRGETRGS